MSCSRLTSVTKQMLACREYTHSIKILCTRKCTCRYRGQHACDVRRLAGWHRCDINKKSILAVAQSVQDLPTVQPVRSRIGNIGEKIAEVIFSRFALAGMYDMGIDETR